MKRWLLLGCTSLLVVSCILLGFQSVFDPNEITGLWYSTEGDNQYRFEHGQITCIDSGISLEEGECFSGAYCMSKGRVTLFVVSGENVAPVTTLYLVHANGQDRLCELEDGTGAWFYRNRNN